ncbi:calcium-binding protein [Ruegeria conchae]|uniref:calcium-binding protein n=1 Tax=Ruegeria conchae TaxID=981384 RepID=UPI0029C7E821|nr:calcium-binding protein [Ruegeria conchae]
MFLIGLFGMAALGGAAYAISDVLVPDETTEEDGEQIDDSVEDELTEGNLLELKENVEEPDSSEDTNTGEIISEHGGNLVIAGDEDANILTGQEGNDQINGYEGGDLIDGGGGNDVIYGGSGDDTLIGNVGNDVLHGGYGDDNLAGLSGNDDLYGRFGMDELEGGGGDDRLFGGQDDDILRGDDGDDQLQGGDGDDFLTGGAGQDALFGGDGDDILNGNDGPKETSPDFLNGGAGDDIILAKDGDIVTGGDGDDEIIVQPEPDQEAATIMDFQIGHDKLLVTWDGPEDPELTIEPDSENNDLTHVRVNGEKVAQIFGAEGLAADDILFVTEAQLAQYTFTG